MTFGHNNGHVTFGHNQSRCDLRSHKVNVTFKVIMTFGHLKGTVTFDHSQGHCCLRSISKSGFSLFSLFLKVTVTLGQGHDHKFYYFHKALAIDYYHAKLGTSSVNSL